jgi:group I intron endonuclease
MKISGIYKIVNKINKKCYMGASTNIKSRWYSHTYELKSHTHDNIHLQRAWDKYGKENFEFLIIEEIPKEQLTRKDQYYLNLCKDNPTLYYNLVYESGGFLDRSGKNNGFYGKTHTEATREKISKTHKGKKLTDKQKQKISINSNPWNKGGHLSEEIKQKISISKLGKCLSENTKRKISLTLLKTGCLRKKDVYEFKNNITNSIFCGTQYDFIKKYNLCQSNVSRLISKERPSHKNWVLID